MILTKYRLLTSNIQDIKQKLLFFCRNFSPFRYQETKDALTIHAWIYLFLKVTYCLLCLHITHQCAVVKLLLCSFIFEYNCLARMLFCTFIATSNQTDCYIGSRMFPKYCEYFSLLNARFYSHCSVNFEDTRNYKLCPLNWNISIYLLLVISDFFKLLYN